MKYYLLLLGVLLLVLTGCGANNLDCASAHGGDEVGYLSPAAEGCGDNAVAPEYDTEGFVCCVMPREEVNTGNDIDDIGLPPPPPPIP